jgi:hypothetical protein
MGHGYEMTTYDPDRQRFMSMPNAHGYEKQALPQRRRWWKTPPEDAGPWLFEVATGRWNRLRTDTPGPSSSFGDTLIYLPGERRAFFLHRNSDVWFYDVPANQWNDLGVSLQARDTTRSAGCARRRNDAVRPRRALRPIRRIWPIRRTRSAACHWTPTPP